MHNLRLLNHSESNPKVEEFYSGNTQSLFLGGIKDLNIIVGANNTRKSRFMRTVIRISHKVIIESAADINQQIHKAGELIDELTEVSKDFGVGLIQFDPFSLSNEESAIISNYLQNSSADRKTLVAENLAELIKSITQSYQTALDEANFDTGVYKLKTLNILSRAMLYLYKHFSNHGNKIVHKNSYPQDDLFQYLVGNFPHNVLGNEIINLAELISCIEKIKAWSDHYESLIIHKYTKNTLYIPALRTSRKLSGTNGTDIYQETIRENYFKSDEIRVQIETGLKLYEKIDLARNGNREDIRNFHAFEKFIGTTFFGSEDIHIIPYRKKGNESDGIKISIPGEIENVYMHDLGEGVQAIINLLFPIFTASPLQWICIDEPENNLHPGFQNIFIRAITQNEYLKNKNLRYFINTHSNHILSESFLSGSDPAIFVFSKRDEKASNISHFSQNEYQTLELLGVMNTSVLITNCSVWVEGVTDRFYLRAFLNAFCKTLEQDDFIPSEGYDYSFVEYGGKNLVHYDFDKKGDDNIAAYFINSNVFLLADNDFDPLRHEKYSKINRPNFRYEQTDLPEIENIIPDKILKDFLLNHLGCDPISVNPIFPITNVTDKMGIVFNGVKKKGKKVVIQAKSGGTLKSDYKSKLSQYVYEQIIKGTYSWADLMESPALDRIIRELYTFIKIKGRVKVTESL